MSEEVTSGDDEVDYTATGICGGYGLHAVVREARLRTVVSLPKSGLFFQ